jgi:hypothetical protein
MRLQQLIEKLSKRPAMYLREATLIRIDRPVQGQRRVLSGSEYRARL